jgi:hypothetical protein
MEINRSNMITIVRTIATAYQLMEAASSVKSTANPRVSTIYL